MTIEEVLHSGKINNNKFLKSQNSEDRIQETEVIFNLLNSDSFLLTPLGFICVGFDS